MTAITRERPGWYMVEQGDIGWHRFKLEEEILNALKTKGRCKYNPLLTNLEIN